MSANIVQFPGVDTSMAHRQPKESIGGSAQSQRDFASLPATLTALLLRLNQDQLAILEVIAIGLKKGEP